MSWLGFHHFFLLEKQWGFCNRSNHNSEKQGHSGLPLEDPAAAPDTAAQRTWLKGKMVSGFPAVVIRHVSCSQRVCWAWEARHLLSAETQYTYWFERAARSNQRGHTKSQSNKWTHYPMTLQGALKRKAVDPALLYLRQHKAESVVYGLGWRVEREGKEGSAG